MRPVKKGPVPKNAAGNEITFSDYARSRRYLIDRIGEYCSYCERKIEANLAVEHVQPKDSNPQLELVWENFLLGCTNCNSTKGKKNIVLDEYVWPDKDDTFKCFSYDQTGIVNVSPLIADPILKLKVQNMLDLVGLQKHPPREGSADWERASDRRFEHRIQAWKEANELMNNYGNSTSQIKSEMIPLIKTIVIHQGFWSIWMKVFENFPEVQVELINGFSGTNSSFFPNLIPVT